MKLAVLNAFAGQEVAETELARRIVRAASALGWPAREVASSLEVKAYAPELVLALHFFTPKLTGFPTYGCLWNPPAFFEGDPRHVESVLSYDGYLASSPALTSWLRQRLAGSAKPLVVAPFYPSCHRTPWRAPALSPPRLFYAGTNWDGPRARELFEALDAEPFLDVYGPRDRWPHLRAAYRGSLPYDGESLLEELHRAGVGLCLHHRHHRAAAVPSLRVFEIAAAGAVALCQEHPFVREAFGDAVLYLEEGLEGPRLAAHIAERMRWIAEHAGEARELARRAHDVFLRRYSLEVLLEGLAAEHARAAAARNIAAGAPGSRPAAPRVQYVVRAGGRPAGTLHRALDSLCAQTAGGVGAVVVRWSPGLDLAPTLERYRGRLPIEIVEGTAGGARSTHLWEGLQAVRAELFGILDDDDALHPDHVASLLPILDQDPALAAAYSGSIRVWEQADGTPAPAPAPTDPAAAAARARTPLEPAELAYGRPFDRGELFALRNFITSNAFLGRGALLRQLPPDPRLPFLEDLFLLLALSVHGPFRYSGQPTCEFYWRAGGTDNCSPVVRVAPEWWATLEEVARLVWSQRLLGEGTAPEAVRTYLSALGQRGAELSDELRQARAEAARLAELVGRQAAALTAEARRWQDECARRDETIAAIERSKGWRVILAARRARDLARDCARAARAGLRGRRG